MTYSPWATLRRHPHLTLVVTRLPRGHAWWLPKEEAIVIDDRLGQAARRCALEHELQHALAGDQPLHEGPDAARLRLRQEQTADTRTARALIDLADLADALCWSEDLHHVAEDLHVTAEIVRIRLDCLHPSERGYLLRRLSMKEHTA